MSESHGPRTDEEISDRSPPAALRDKLLTNGISGSSRAICRLGPTALRLLQLRDCGLTIASMRTWILLVEDEADLAQPLIFSLRREGYETLWVRTGREALAATRSTAPPSLLIVDRGLPDTEGLEVVRTCRAEGFDGAVIVLSSRASEIERVEGLDSGADDYQAKPFGLAELTARVRAHLRRIEQAKANQSPAQAGEVRIEEDSRRAMAGDVEIPLSHKEFDILAMLARQVGVVVDRQALTESVWDENWFGSTKALDVAIARLRKKLSAFEVTDQIVAVRGVGFRLERASTTSI